MLLIRATFTVVVVVLAVWLAAAGNPVGGLVIVPAIAVWLRRAVEARGERRPA